ncbi:MAG: 50S ribosomal protein L23 [Parcubacteria group bacterium GW2011_GWC2_42_12]|uniref:Large ribosomal subunit protein uL23 n=1 Tax=Candidatus Falkowbacteria bacterium GW2011_GWA2_41_14 TaxID=1618635 RepID=A0A0G0UVW5_9BACT|nr:MAG: 50S ribosomal protein L23 [Candidatus Falkowbacteria bacterium GW2011_GWA2_41_14]KKS35141.1 MAG: 50S ribosomal protein L23 [Parcubacteria group bacterium GW2011_GWC2_42_12]
MTGGDCFVALITGLLLAMTSIKYMFIFGKKIDPSTKFGASDKKKPTAKPEKVETEIKSMKDLYGPAAATKTKQVKKGQTRAAYGNAYKILVKPLVTEKVSNLGALNKYVFAVASDANKIEIAKAIKEIYGIKPLGVNIIKILGKQTRYGKISGKRKDWKKAIITLPKGETIKIYEGV